MSQHAGMAAAGQTFCFLSEAKVSSRTKVSVWMVFHTNYINGEELCSFSFSKNLLDVSVCFLSDWLLLPSAELFIGRWGRVCNLCKVSQQFLSILVSSYNSIFNKPWKINSKFNVCQIFGCDFTLICTRCCRSLWGLSYCFHLWRIQVC